METAEPSSADSATPGVPGPGVDPVIIDARGSHCPVPVNMLSQAVTTASGTVIELLADDPNSRVDVPVWCRLKRHELIEVNETDGSWRFVVRASSLVGGGGSGV